MIDLGIHAVVQARCGSTRYPNKVLADIAGKTMVERVLERAQLSSIVNTVTLATTTNPEDEVLLSIARNMGVNAFAGSEKDVLDRFYQCTKDARIIVRLTADCPLVDYTIIDGVVQYLVIGDYDYVYEDYFDGMDCEVFSRITLEKAWEGATLSHDREHVTSYMKDHSELFKVGHFMSDIPYPVPKLSVDTPQDLELVRKVFSILGEYCTVTDIVELFGGGLGIQVE